MSRIASSSSPLVQMWCREGFVNIGYNYFSITSRQNFKREQVGNYKD